VERDIEPKNSLQNEDPQLNGIERYMVAVNNTYTNTDVENETMDDKMT